MQIRWNGLDMGVAVVEYLLSSESRPATPYSTISIFISHTDALVASMISRMTFHLL
jgi:hypothetical protein